MKDKAIGFYFTLIAAILSAAGMILYNNVMYKIPLVYVFCLIAVLLTSIVVLSAFMGKTKKIFHFLPVVNAALMSSAAIWAVYLMVNQLGYVVAGLDKKSTIMGFVYFEIVVFLSILLNILASFFRQENKPLKEKIQK